MGNLKENQEERKNLKENQEEQKKEYMEKLKKELPSLADIGLHLSDEDAAVDRIFNLVAKSMLSNSNSDPSLENWKLYSGSHPKFNVEEGLFEKLHIKYNSYRTDKAGTNLTESMTMESNSWITKHYEAVQSQFRFNRRIMELYHTEMMIYYPQKNHADTLTDVDLEGVVRNGFSFLTSMIKVSESDSDSRPPLSPLTKLRARIRNFEGPRQRPT